MRIDLARWLFRQIEGLTGALWLSTLARILGQLAGVVLLVVAVIAVAEQGWWGIMVLIVTALLKAGLRYGEHYAGHWLAFTALERLRQRFFQALAPQAPAATAGRASADLTSRATDDIDKIEVFFAHTIPPTISAVISPAIALVVLGWATQWSLAGVLAIFLAIILLLPLLLAPLTWARARRVAAADAAVVTHVGDNIQGIREIITFDAQEKRLAGLDERTQAAESARGNTIAGIREMVMVALSLGMLVAVAAVEAPLLDKAIAVAVGLALTAPVRAIEDFSASLDAAFAAAQRVREVIDAQPAVVDGPGALPGAPELSVEDVHVKFSQEVPALDGVSATFAAGQWSAVVGVSGSGKSTLVSLLLRARDPDSGVVRFGGHDVREYTLEDLRSRIAFVDQRPTVLPGSVADNLRLGNQEATEEELAHALRLVGLDMDLDQRLAERGVSISGGQLQRLAIARALVVKPQVLVLDEALSQLDAATSDTVRRNLAEVGLTVVEVTHRTDLLPEDTPVIVIDNGRIVDRGKVSELRGARGAFDALEARV